MLFDLVIPSLETFPREESKGRIHIYIFYKDIHSSTIYKSEKLDISQMSNNGKK